MIIYSRTALAQTSDGELVKLTTVGPEQDELKINDQDSNELLRNIYNQIRVLNFQMATITENHLDEIGE